ncbi:hypothetical protein ANCCAN_01865 [Ancylostoma caninum]|uniref:Uncharacterized protein n=1 Tax=Ancylostoma caninum TaxID=29170 RepID=A0A368H9U0_ANCCA|nr:hypothetical protein ANCCAN_01865 [Ancylostoma caninum]
MAHLYPLVTLVSSVVISESLYKKIDCSQLGNYTLRSKLRTIRFGNCEPCPERGCEQPFGLPMLLGRIGSVDSGEPQQTLSIGVSLLCCNSPTRF